MKPTRKLIEALMTTLEMTGTVLTERAQQAFAEELAMYPEAAALAALSRCQREVRGRVTLADVLSRIDDGHPGADEAWALIPQGEGETTVWTQEIAEAWGEVRALAEEDHVAARMAFREVYTRLLNQARDARRAPCWFVSVGFDGANEGVIREAARRGRLSSAQASALLPPPPATPSALLPAPERTQTADGEPGLAHVNVAEFLRQIRERLAHS